MSRIPTLSNIEILFERCLPTTISLIRWSPRISVCALASENGDLFLFRYNPWQKVWDVPPREDHSKITVLEWSLDQLILAAGRDNGLVELYEVERGVVLTQFSISAEVTCMSWSSHELEHESLFLTSLKESNSCFYTFFRSLPKLESVEELCIKQEELFEPNLKKKFSKQDLLSVLLIGSKNGEVWVNIDGFFCPSFFKIPSQDLTVTSLKLSSNLTDIFVTYFDGNGLISLCVVRTTLFAKFNNEIRLFSRQFILISFLLDYMYTVINVMSESYEAVLTKLDEKLAKFVDKLPDDVLVVDEFLKLLSMGNNRPEILPFISSDLSFSNPRNKKLPNDIETSHQKLSSLLKTHLLPSSEMLYYKLVQMQRTCYVDSFVKLGYKPAAFESCSMLVGTFMLKCFELLQVTQTTKESFQVFFEWINIVGDRSQGTPNTQKTLTMKQYEILIDFLMNHLTQSGRTPCVKFNVELVEQYFMDKNLSCQQKYKSPWLKLAEETLPQDFPLIRPDPNSSLLQVIHALQRRVKDSFQDASTKIYQSLFDQLVMEKLKTITSSTSPILLQQKDTMLIFFTLNPPLEKYLFVLRYALEAFHYTFISLSGIEGSHRIQSIRECSELCITLLVEICFAEAREKHYTFILPLDCLKEARYFSISYDFPPIEEIPDLSLQIPATTCIKVSLDLYKVGEWDVRTHTLAGFVSKDKRRLRVYQLDSNEKSDEKMEQDTLDESTIEAD